MQLLVDLNREYRRYRPNVSEKVQLANTGLQWVLSSNVSAVGVDGQDLIVRFHNGSLYAYDKQAYHFDKMLQSNSKGHYVWVHLRRKGVPYRKIGALPFKSDDQVTDEEIFELVKNDGMAFENRLERMGLAVIRTSNGGIETISTQQLGLYDKTEKVIENITNELIFNEKDTLEEIENKVLNKISKNSEVSKVTIFNTKRGVNKKTLEKQINHLENMMNEYENQIVEIRFGKSPVGTLGQVERYGTDPHSIYNVRDIDTQQTIYVHKRQTDGWENFRNFNAIIDEGNEDLYVTTHEFAHTLYMSEQVEYYPQEHPISMFDKELKSIKKKWLTEMNKLSRETTTGISEDRKIEIYNRKKEINISNYARVSNDEFLAESFAQAKLSSKPSPYAKQVLEIVKKYFKKV